jgi:hypothetical protein
MDFSRLDNLAEMQNRAFGTNTALSKNNAYGVGGTDGSQIRKQNSAYGRALRILDRQARRGDARSALQAIGVRDQANQMGFSPGGIQRKSEVDAMTRGQMQAQTQSAMGMQAAQETERRRNAFLGNSFLVNPNPGAANVDPGFTANPNPGATNMDPGFTAPKNRLYAGLDVLEAGQSGNQAQLDTAVAGAQTLGVANPKSILNTGDKLKYRRTLDTALGQAKTPEEIAALKARGTRYGVPAEAFDRRAKWWETNRR